MTEYEHVDVEVHYGEGYWLGFTRVGEGGNLPPDHGPWSHKETLKIFKNYPLDRIVPEREIRAGIDNHGYHRCQLNEEQIKRLRMGK
jgi:hypothetical protein